MPRRRSVKGVHQLYMDTQCRGERWITCACGAQWHDRDPSTVWSLYWQHSQGIR